MRSTLKQRREKREFHKEIIDKARKEGKWIQAWHDPDVLFTPDELLEKQAQGKWGYYITANWKLVSPQDIINHAKEMVKYHKDVVKRLERKLRNC